MRLLLDTGVLLWWLGNHRGLGATARAVIADPANIVFVSAVSIWEARIKQSLGKLDIPKEFLAAVRSEAFELLPISAEHADAVGALPDHHRDPFDRLLVAQAMVENLSIVSSDEMFPRYPPRIILA